MKIIAIFSNDIKLAQDYLKKLIGEMKYKNVESFSEYPRCRAVLTNGDEYKVLSCNDSMRGHKYNKAIVFQDVPKEFLETRVYPGLYSNDDSEPEIEVINE